MGQVNITGGGKISGISNSVKAIGVKRPGHGNAGRPLEIITNHFATDVPDGKIYHYDGMDNPPPQRVVLTTSCFAHSLGYISFSL